MAQVETMSEQELRWRLKEALAIIKEKEKGFEKLTVLVYHHSPPPHAQPESHYTDLIIAAEIGQQLVTTNAALLTENENLLARIQDLSHDHQKPSSESSPNDTQSNNNNYERRNHQPSTGAKQEGTPPTSPPLNSPSRSAVKASKKASLSLSMSRLAMTELEKAEPVSYIANSEEDDEEESEEDLATRAKKTLKRTSSSSSIYDYVTNLERSNSDLRAQLSVALANLQDAEQIHSRSLSHLRRTNTDLQNQLHQALRDLRDAEQAHTRSVRTLEADLESLRGDFTDATLAAHQLQLEKSKLLKTHAEVIKDSHSMELSDSLEISKLQARIRELETAQSTLQGQKKDLERKVRNVYEELEEMRTAFEEARGKVEAAVRMREEFERRGALVNELREQVEGFRSYVEALEGEGSSLLNDDSGRPIFPQLLKPSHHSTNTTELSIYLKNDGTGEWEWTPWLQNVRDKAWQRDIRGLREEIDDLTKHRQQAYTKLKTGIDLMVTSIASYMPSPIKAITTRVVGIPAPTPSATVSTNGVTSSAGAKS
ncbi:hypothetical protein HDV05_003460 [Chytridiales sp. JEL 0842]|nr:hypothetical protein HDV05_003460 [Chytridiales sp. JEL 0842]